MNIPAPFSLVDLEFDKTTEMALLLDAQAGYATITYGPNFPGSSAVTGLANDTTPYTATISIDALGTPHSISYSAQGSTIQTFATLVSSLQTAVVPFATVALVNNTIVITSATTGPTSSVVVTDTGGFPLFGSVHNSVYALVSNVSVKGTNEYLQWGRLDTGTQSNVQSSITSFLAATTANTNVTWTSGTDILAFYPIAPATTVTNDSDTGLTVGTLYDINVNIDGAGAINVPVKLPLLEGNNSYVSFQHLTDAINAAFGANTILGTITAGSGYVNGTYNNVPLTGGKGFGATANITVSGNAVTAVTIVNPGAGYKVGDSLSALTTNIGGGTAGTGFAVAVAATSIPAVATFTSGAVAYVMVTSNNGNVGTTSSVALTAGTNNNVIAGITAGYGVANGPLGGYEAVSFSRAVTVTPTTSPGIGGAGTNYDFTVAIDGAAAATHTVSLITADTMTTIAGKMQATLTGATVAAVGTALVITSSSTGTGSTIVITHPTTGSNADLFTSIGTGLVATVAYGASFAGVGGGAGVNGTTNVTFPVTKTVAAGNESSQVNVATVFTNWYDVLQKWPSPTGFGALFTTATNANIRKTNKPFSKGGAIRTAVYYNGTDWLYYDTDVAVGGTGTTVSPPEVV